ncbi:MAG: hypothetical protein A2X08_00645 [Bacteroidetes bacterium GWA2_32_17]|nr:MAG: hypothetical protein A2X08_00645 [Bacteroidetes bacterium GWA2_32_17]
MGKKLSENEIKEILKAAFWDKEVDINLLYNSIIDKNNNFYPIDSTFLFSRILLSVKWHYLLKIVPKEKWIIMLDTTVIERLFPKSLKNKFYYARKILLQ